MSSSAGNMASEWSIDMTIAVFGASGYQGKLVAAELARRGIETVLVGRDRGRLRDAAAAAGFPGTEVRQATADDPEALAAAFRAMDVVINCAGPFTSSGEAVVRAAIKAGCHYADTAGEQLYIKQIFDTLSADAERAGVTVIPAMTDGGVPGDLIAHLLAEHIDPIDELTSAHLITSNGEPPSRGSLRSVLATLETLQNGGLTYQDGDWRFGIPLKHSFMAFPGSTQPIPVVKFPLQEVITVPRHVRVRRIQGVAEADLGARLSSPFTPEFIDNLPEGPTTDSRRDQRFTIVVDAIADHGQHARGVVQGPDTYGTTAVIAVEGAHRLATHGAKPGVLAPAQAYDPADFLNSLAPYGIIWTIETHHAPTQPTEP
jgi:short subunit dehydrogenase-like uncharacterized protein